MEINQEATVGQRIKFTSNKDRSQLIHVWPYSEITKTWWQNVFLALILSKWENNDRSI